jgi:kynurenine formamidase/ribulose-5-phosphate 4-epimerase/fuculose-1-phosphate aldolase
MSIIAENSALAEELCRYCRLCYARYLVGAAGGNLSARVPGMDAYLVTASNVALRDAEPSTLVVVDGRGDLLEGGAGLRPSKETAFHLSIYRLRAEVNAVVHVHPTYATVFSVWKMQIPTATISASLKLKQGPVVAEAEPGSRELCDHIERAVRSSGDDVRVLLLERHGLVAFDSALSGAFNAAELAEDTARIAFLSARGGMTTLEGLRRGSVLDLSAPLGETTPCYPTDPPFRKEWFVDYESSGVRVSRLSFGSHIGTHVEAPSHYLGDGLAISDLPIERFFGPAVAVAAVKQEGENIDVIDVEAADIRENDIVLFHTGWDRRAGTDRFFEGEWPGFTLEAIDCLLKKRVKAIGGDIASADSPSAIREGARVHKKALAAGVPIFENLINLHELTGKRFLFVGLPLRVDGGEASPIRAIAIF